MTLPGFGFFLFGFGGSGRQPKNYLYVQDGSGKSEQYIASDGAEIIVRRG